MNTQTLYVTEMFNPLENIHGERSGGWLPCDGAAKITRKEAREETRKWRSVFPEDNFRTVKYMYEAEYRSHYGR